ncbi:hypothetical protein BF49_0207 [Bradyrhizobium sp.]|nr:hypothetical protein BF49_0207 [Bradyrhizobium sp.]
MCDTGGGTSANFLHTTALENKFGGLPKGKRDCADNPLDKLPTETRKSLKLTGLSKAARAIRGYVDGCEQARLNGRTEMCESNSPSHRLKP